ncbi:hypothetical protein B0H19DRAFT_1246122 [Mycena capillaripes]|nr:hypothetical protein B0H19DRAFT_1246122 [Mycena capillaripes]
MAAHKDSISVLPLELLSEVFAQYASVYADAPIILGTVSRLFRHVAYTTPSVWSHLKFNDADGSRKAALWLAMSKACQVNVQIDMSRVGRAEHGVDMLALQTLRSHTDRITSLCLRTDTQAQARAVLATIYSDVSPTGTALRSLRISAATFVSGVLLPFPAIPSITKLETTNVALTVLPSLDLGRLQGLRIIQPLISAPVAADDILELIRGAPSLRKLKVEARIADPTRTAEAEPYFLPQLEKLQVRANNIVALLDRFIVPALRVLHLNDLDGKRADASADMGAALHRLLVRTELGKGDVKSNELRVFKLVGVEVERGNAVWERCVQRIKTVEVFNVDSPGEKEGHMQENIVEECPEEPRPRPIKAGFGFGFGFGAAEVTSPGN